MIVKIGSVNALMAIRAIAASFEQTTLMAAAADRRTDADRRDGTPNVLDAFVESELVEKAMIDRDIEAAPGRWMEQTVEVLISIIRAIEGNQTFINRQPYGEPQLGPRGLFRSLSTKEPQKEEDLAIWWLLNMSDGSHDLLSIAEKSGQKIDALISASQRLEQADLLKKS